MKLCNKAYSESNAGSSISNDQHVLSHSAKLLRKLANFDLEVNFKITLDCLTYSLPQN